MVGKRKNGAHVGVAAYIPKGGQVMSESPVGLVHTFTWQALRALGFGPDNSHPETNVLLARGRYHMYALRWESALPGAFRFPEERRGRGELEPRMAFHVYTNAHKRGAFGNAIFEIAYSEEPSLFEKEQALRPGLVVRLKSGGPAMTITEIFPNGNLSVAWFAGDDARLETFAPEALIEFDAGKPIVTVVAHFDHNREPLCGAHFSGALLARYTCDVTCPACKNLLKPAPEVREVAPIPHAKIVPDQSRGREFI
jgi:uncharacterized protein YodC (DUF2158 family)